MLTQERLKKLLHYDPETGIFTWIRSGRGRRSIKTQSDQDDSNQLKKTHRYIRITIDHKTYTAHRLVFLYMYGVLPTKVVDHINGMITDNRLANLREVSMKLNMQNLRKARIDNKTGYLGVCLKKGCSKYSASINIADKQVHLGYFTNPDEAHQAYLKAKRNLHQGCTI